MRIQLWSKLFKRKPITAVILGLVLISALLTVYRLASSTSSSSSRDPHEDAQNSASYSKTGRSTSPVDLSWPLPFPQEKESSKKHSISTTTRRKITVDDNQLKKLKKIYPMLDTNSDSYVSIDELRNWIISKVKEHLQGALRENIFLFTSIDTDPKNGQVSWKEYHTWFLSKNGNKTHDVDNNSELHPDLERSIREKIAWDQAAWSEAARTDPDFLNLDEFLSFRHPESSHSSLLLKADDLMAEYDLDADEALTWDEYSSIKSESILVRHSDLKKRKEEFTLYIDKNKDGRLDKREVLGYLDPRNPRHAHLEALSLVELADINKDQQLSMNEILSAAEIFLASKVIDIETNFHDEF